MRLIQSWVLYIAVEHYKSHVIATEEAIETLAQIHNHPGECTESCACNTCSCSGAGQLKLLASQSILLVSHLMAGIKLWQKEQPSRRAARAGG